MAKGSGFFFRGGESPSIIPEPPPLREKGIPTPFGQRLREADYTDKLDQSWGEASFNTRVSAFRQFLDEACAARPS
jgi:hypothetical protein